MDTNILTGSAVAIGVFSFCIVLLGGLIIVQFKYVAAKKKLKKIKEAVALIENENENLKEDFQSVTQQIEQLKKYEVIADAEQEASRLLSNAKTEAAKLSAEAEAKISDADEKLGQMRLEARRKVFAIEKEGKIKQEKAIEDSKKIIADARSQAETIAGNALKAVEDAERYRKTVRAMQNKIKGYGDEYLVPNRSLLDELAEEFSHKDAGLELKHARQRTKNMIKQGIAADCDYVETRRKTTAIRFVLDAFNGKVATSLSKVKHDNYGKLQQEIQDAFNLVNTNGEAFRSARISSIYLDARLDELKWAVTTHQLKLEEREEQRKIKEAIREEEKARREYEKAIKVAVKEEKTLQDAMAKARKELEAATAKQRAKLEQQLADLQTKLEEAEAKNQRALSMAQQTKRGHVYVISNVGSFGEDIFKIGLTRRLEPLDRVKELGDASVPFPFDVHAMIYSEDAPSLEKELHRTFEQNQMNKVNSRKEFFQVGIKAIREIVEARGLNVHWTMKAEAAQYRESLALAQAELRKVS